MLALSSLFLRWLFHTFTAIITITSVTFLIIKIHYLCQVVHSDPGLWPSAHLRDEKPSHSLSCRWDYHFHCHHPHRNYHCCYHWHCHRHWMRNLHNFSVASRIIIFIVIVIIVELYSCFLSLKSVIFQVVLSWHPPVCPTWSNCASLKNLSWPTALVLPRSSSSTSGHFCRLLLTLVRMKIFQLFPRRRKFFNHPLTDLPRHRVI